MYFILDFSFWVKSLRIVRLRILRWLWCSVTHKSRGTGTGWRLLKESHLPTVPYRQVESTELFVIVWFHNSTSQSKGGKGFYRWDRVQCFSYKIISTNLASGSLQSDIGARLRIHLGDIHKMHSTVANNPTSVVHAIELPVFPEPSTCSSLPSFSLLFFLPFPPSPSFLSFLPPFSFFFPLLPKTTVRIDQ